MGLLAPLQQGGDEGVDPVDDAIDMDAEGEAPVVDLVLPEPSVGAGGDPGVVAHHLDRTEVIERGVAQRLHRLEAGHVGHHPDGVGPSGAQLGHGGVEGFGLDVGEHDLHALAGEALPHGPPDTAGAPGDDGDLVLQVLHVSPPQFGAEQPRGPSDHGSGRGRATVLRGAPGRSREVIADAPDAPAHTGRLGTGSDARSGHPRRIGGRRHGWRGPVCRGVGAMSA